MSQGRTASFTGITREAIERDHSRRELRLRAEVGHDVLDDDALDASLDAQLAAWDGQRDLHVFGYGSLIWNPCLEHGGRDVATVHGYHRRFCHWSHAYRGTPEWPGLVLALDRGGACRGVIYRLPAERARHELRLLWRREMFAGSYRAKWLRAHTDHGIVPALGFVMNHASPLYAGRLADADVVERLARAHGQFGSGADYLCQTAAALHAVGLADPHLDRLVALLAQREIGHTAAA